MYTFLVFCDVNQNSTEFIWFISIQQIIWIYSRIDQRKVIFRCSFDLNHQIILKLIWGAENVLITTVINESDTSSIIGRTVGLYHYSNCFVIVTESLHIGCILESICDYVWCVMIYRSNSIFTSSNSCCCF